MGGASRIYGEEGADDLYGSVDDDYVRGGAGADSVNGGYYRDIRSVEVDPVRAADRDRVRALPDREAHKGEAGPGSSRRPGSSLAVREGQGVIRSRQVALRTARGKCFSPGLGSSEMLDPCLTPGPFHRGPAHRA